VPSNFDRSPKAIAWTMSPVTLVAGTQVGVVARRVAADPNSIKPE
jgi:hypothetical protein